jgi:hypothetical protein
VGAAQVKLVDASSWIEYLRGRHNAPGQRVKLLLERGDAAWCDITLLELWSGAQGDAEKMVLEELERELRLYPVNEQVWTAAISPLFLPARQSPPFGRAGSSAIVIHLENVIVAALDSYCNQSLPPAKKPCLLQLWIPAKRSSL